MRNKKNQSNQNMAHIIIGICFISFIPLLFPSDQISKAKVHGAKAVIVDQLRISWSNPSFVKDSKEILEGAGYKVDYYSGEQVTVEFFRNLPTLGYKLIILRVHSSYIHEYLSLAIFTSEPYSQKRYVYEQLRNRVASGFIQPYHEGDPRFLVITDKFVRFSMEGSFDDAVIIMMGCSGIKRCAATAFLEKGARAYIGWDSLVSGQHSDRATIQLLKHLFVEEKDIADAVAETIKNVRLEPQYKSMLLFWPIQVGNDTIQTTNN